MEKKPISHMHGQKEKTEKAPVSQFSLSILSPWVNKRLTDLGSQQT